MVPKPASQPNSSSPPVLLDMPVEILLVITQYLRQKHVEKLARTCTALNAIFKRELYRYDHQHDNCLALHYASQMNKRIKTLKHSLRFGADVNCVFPTGMTPLTNAIRNRAVRIVRYLLEHGADVHQPTSTPFLDLERLARYPINWASRFRQHDNTHWRSVHAILELLLKFGAKVDQLPSLMPERDGTTASFAVRKPPIFDVCESGSPFEIVSLLISHGANVSEVAVDYPSLRERVTPLQILLSREDGIGHPSAKSTLQIARHVIAAGGYSTITTNGVDASLFNCLHPARLVPMAVPLFETLSKGANPDGRDLAGFTPLLRLLMSLNKWKPIYYFDNTMWATKEEREAKAEEGRDIAEHLVSRLLAAGANPNATATINGIITPGLHLFMSASTEINSQEIPEMLLKAGASVKGLDSAHQTALHHVCMMPVNETTKGRIKFLIEHDVPRKVRNADGSTAEDLLCRNPAVDKKILSMVRHGKRSFRSGKQSRRAKSAKSSAEEQSKESHAQTEKRPWLADGKIVPIPFVETDYFRDESEGAQILGYLRQDEHDRATGRYNRTKGNNANKW